MAALFLPAVNVPTGDLSSMNEPTFDFSNVETCWAKLSGVAASDAAIMIFGMILEVVMG